MGPVGNGSEGFDSVLSGGWGRGTMCVAMGDPRHEFWDLLGMGGVGAGGERGGRPLGPAPFGEAVPLPRKPPRPPFCGAILTVVGTDPRHCRNSFEFLTAAVQAHFARQPAPSLLARV